MERVLERLPSGARVCVIRLRSLGDCVLTTPALALLKSGRPDLEIGVVVEDRFRDIFERNPDIAAILRPAPSAVAAFRPHLCLNLHGGTRSIALTLASAARLRAGFTHFRAQCTYNIRIPRAQDVLGVERTVHTAEHLASAMFYLGVPRQDIPRARIYAEPARRAAPFSLLHPFAAAPEKCWPYFPALADHLAHAGPKPLILAGPADDTGAFARHEVVRNAPLSEVASLLRSAALFVGNDSGPAHMAAACGTPLVVLFGASDPVVWAPWKAHAEQIIRDRIADIGMMDVLVAIEMLKVQA
jgi:ADP-heptose:LPS heptosyltransferase